MVRIGIDFDNTIAGYDHLFQRLGYERGWLPEGFDGGKKRAAETIRELVQGEEKWMELQAAVYGANMADAELIEGVGEFLTMCRKRGIEVYIVSHKTQFAARDSQRIDLRAASLEWMTAKGFFSEEGFALPQENVFFESTRKEKCQRIAALQCDHFIDDLEIVFREPDFPAAVKRHLYHPEAEAQPEGLIQTYRSWTGLADGILNQN